MRKIKIAVALSLIFIIGISFAALAAIEASEVISSAKVTLSSSTKKATFDLKTKVDCQSISVTSYTLYKSNGSVVTSGSIGSGSGKRYYKTVDFSSHITSGNSYYVTAVFNADGETKTVTSVTVSF